MQCSGVQKFIASDCANECSGQFKSSGYINLRSISYRDSQQIVKCDFDVLIGRIMFGGGQRYMAIQGKA